MSSRQKRQLTGWNIFQREQLGELGSLDPVTYKNALNRIAIKWRALSNDDKQAFKVQAEYEQVQRAVISETPLPLKGSQKTQGEMDLGSRGLKRISLSRLQKNLSNFAAHPVWQLPHQLGESTCVDGPAMFFLTRPYPIFLLLMLMNPIIQVSNPSINQFFLVLRCFS